MSTTLTVLSDNILFDERLRTTWGYSVLIDHQGSVLLFDTGGDGPILLANMDTLGIDPHNIEGVFLSHTHKDHTGGLAE